VIDIPCDSRFFVESKSLKLYLGGYHFTVFESVELVIEQIQRDLSSLLHVTVTCYCYEPLALRRLSQGTTISWPGECLDALDVKLSAYERDPDLLSCTDTQGKMTCYTHLFRSLCPVTGQPDWATIWMSCVGTLYTKASLLAYLVSYRNHQGFHERCVEQIFLDLWGQGTLSSLQVLGAFMRRGGIDLHPFRSSEPAEVPMALSWMGDGVCS